MKLLTHGRQNMERNMMTLIRDGSESLCSELTTSKLRQLMRLTYHTNSKKTNSWIWLLKNLSKPTLAWKTSHSRTNNTELEMNQLQPKLTGEKREEFLMLKTKDNAGHAGHSQPLVLWNLLTELKTRELVYSLNKT